MQDLTKEWNVEQRNELYREAFNTWGEMPQVDMLVEELGECIVATQKLFKRDYCLKRMTDLASEVADVRIMCEEIVLLLDELEDHKLPDGYDPGAMGSFSDMVEQQIHYKLQRTAERLQAKKAGNV